MESIKRNKETMSLENIGEGAAVERFGIELDKVIENILDINTEAEVVREITLSVKIKPTEDRDMIAFGIQARSKLAPLKAFVSKAIVNPDGKAQELIRPKQPDLPLNNVTSIKK